jgi:hypothetical protein
VKGGRDFLVTILIVSSLFKMEWTFEGKNIIISPYELDNSINVQLAMLLHKLALIEIKSESSSVIWCNQEGGHCHLTNPLSL